MARATESPAASKTRRAIVKLLKTEGPTDSTQLAAKLGLTAMAVRLHLYALQEEKLVTHDSRPVPIGRPVKIWKLTPAADRLFPEAYAELSVALIDAMGDAFGATGMKQILEARLARQIAKYRGRMRPEGSLKEKLEDLARIRSEEGYMAELAGGGDGENFLFIENHCPICAAATVCKGFCATEIDLFHAVLGAEVQIDRCEHIVSGNRRCAYRIAPGPIHVENEC
jgi:predicted ArsR family transcriptional regulator